MRPIPLLRTRCRYTVARVGTNPDTSQWDSQQEHYVNMRTHDHRGFTLIELIVIIGILGTLMLIGAPSMSRFLGSNRLAGAANIVVGDLRYARSLAASQRKSYEFRNTNTGYTIVCLSPARTVLTRTLESGVTFAAHDTTTFFAWGLTESAVLTLQKDGHSRIVRMNSTGEVTRD